MASATPTSRRSPPIPPWSSAAAPRSLLRCSPLLGLLAIAAIVLNVAQTGLMISPAGLKPKIGAINPAKGVKRIFFSADGAVNLGKALAKMAVIGVVVFITLRGKMSEIADMGQVSVPSAARAPRPAGLRYRPSAAPRALPHRRPRLGLAAPQVHERPAYDEGGSEAGDEGERRRPADEGRHPPPPPGAHEPHDGGRP